MGGNTKLFYRIGEVCRRMELQPHILRYWESEFSALQPVKNSAGQRIYSQRDLALIENIRKLLYEQGFTIAGARRVLRGTAKGEPDRPAPEIPEAAEPAGPAVSSPSLASIRQELRCILSILEGWTFNSPGSGGRENPK